MEDNKIVVKISFHFNIAVQLHNEIVLETIQKAIPNEKKLGSHICSFYHTQPILDVTCTITSMHEHIFLDPFFHTINFFHNLA